jgi:putative aminopeptidase FrvX
MSVDALREELARLTALDAPSGFEEPVLRHARDELQACCSQVEVDVRGNVYGFQPGTDPQAPTVMVTAHADEIGFQVTSILPAGFLRFTKIGGPTDMVLPGRPCGC